MKEQKKEIAVIGHSLIVDANRTFWNTFAKECDFNVSLFLPKTWVSNLVGKLQFQVNTTTDNSLQKIYDIPCFFKGNGSFYFFSPLKLFRNLQEKKYDCFIMNQETWSLSLLVFVFLKFFSRNKNIPLHLIVAQNIKKKHLYFLRFFERCLTKHVNTIFFCTSEIKDVLRWKGINNKAVYLPLSFNPESFIKKGKKFNINPIRIGFIGRISHEKGVLLFLDVAKSIIQQGYNLEIYIAGNGPLLEKIKEYDFVKYLGVIAHRNAHEFYEMIDICVVPSQSRPFWKEQFGRVLVEAAAAKCLVIGSSSGSIPEVMSMLEMPYIFQENSVNDFTNKVQQAISDIQNNKAESIAKKSQELSFKNFSHVSVAKYLSKQISIFL